MYFRIFWLLTILVTNFKPNFASFDLGRCNLECNGQSLVSEGSETSIKSQLQGPPGMNSISSYFPRSCSDMTQNYGVDASGIYTIYPFGNATGLLAYCDLNTAGGGWMLFQRRVDGSEDFYRNFSDYVRGFGKLAGEFWLGLDTIHELTKDGEYELRVDMEDFDNDTRYAYYSNFVVGNGTDFTATISGYVGTAGDGLSFMNGQKFSAKDFDQDTHSKSCAITYEGGWWYSDCHFSNPNGLYLGGDHESYANGINWDPFRGHHHSLKKIEFKLRRK